MKREDIRGVLDQYGSYGIRSLIVTKMDETETVGNVLSICHERDLPLLFFTDGQRVPKDIHKASAATVLGYLRGFSLDFEHLWMNQVNGDSLS
jgi:flagellar biosynthesis protein FlhF